MTNVNVSGGGTGQPVVSGDGGGYGVGSIVGILVAILLVILVVWFLFFRGGDGGGNAVPTAPSSHSQRLA